MADIIDRKRPIALHSTLFSKSAKTTISPYKTPPRFIWKGWRQVHTVQRDESPDCCVHDWDGSISQIGYTTVQGS